MRQSDVFPRARKDEEWEANEMSVVTGTARTGEVAAVAEAPLLMGCL